MTKKLLLVFVLLLRRRLPLLQRLIQLFKRNSYAGHPDVPDAGPLVQNRALAGHAAQAAELASQPDANSHWRHQVGILPVWCGIRCSTSADWRRSCRPFIPAARAKGRALMPSGSAAYGFTQTAVPQAILKADCK